MSGIAVASIFVRCKLTAAKIFTVGFGLLFLVFGIWQFDHQGDVAVEKMGRLTNVIAAPMVSFFLLGSFFRRVNSAGAVIGAIAGVAFAVVFTGIPGIVEQQLDWINWMWGGGLATLFNIAVGYCASYLFPPPTHTARAGTTLW